MLNETLFVFLFPSCSFSLVSMVLPYPYPILEALLYAHPPHFCQGICEYRDLPILEHLVLLSLLSQMSCQFVMISIFICLIFIVLPFDQVFLVELVVTTKYWFNEMLLVFTQSSISCLPYFFLVAVFLWWGWCYHILT